MNSKEENSQDFCPNYVQEFGLRVPEAGAGIFIQPVGARNRVGMGLSYRPARLLRLAELIPWN